MRIGISSTNAKGGGQKPSGDKFLDYIRQIQAGRIGGNEKTAKKAAEVLRAIATEGVAKAMGKFN